MPETDDGGTPQGPAGSPGQEPGDGSAQAAQPEAPRKFAGKYDTVEDLEKSYQHAISFATKVSQENKQWRDYEANLKAREAAAAKPEEPIDLFNAIVEGRGEEAIDEVSRRREAKRQAEAAASQKAWADSRFAEWNELVAVDPNVARFEKVIGNVARQYPDRSVALLVRALEQQERTEGRSRVSEGSERDGAEKVAAAIAGNRTGNPADANGRAPTPARAKLSREEQEIAKVFGIAPEVYAKHRDASDT